MGEQSGERIKHALRELRANFLTVDKEPNTGPTAGKAQSPSNFASNLAAI
jgi:hypothetical protein